jgi:hypothetical protein
MYRTKFWILFGISVYRTNFLWFLGGAAQEALFYLNLTFDSYTNLPQISYEHFGREYNPFL